ncbi:hypothetical protein [uncultured Pluralibacter sp.]|uniref:hypothetical protein n=1 Tax=uncultured Pluralibacter sp. TaxID=1490864 RepID=UPI00260E3492|nr:hypothetical protein [uncultured Pluralibacter sp.]
MIKPAVFCSAALLACSAASAADVTATLTNSSPVSVSLANDSPAFLFQDETGKLYYQDTLSQYSPYSPDNHDHSWRVFTGTTLDNVYARFSQALAAYRAQHPGASNADIHHNVYVPLYDKATVQNTIGLCDSSGLTKAIMPPKRADGKAVSGYDSNNFCGLMGVWVDPDTGYWYGPVHDELFGNTPRFDAIELAVSKDKGQNWSITGPIITSPYNIIGSLGANGTKVRSDGFPQDTYHYGGGDPRLFVDTASGYFYLFYTSRIMNKTGNSGFNNTMWAHVARAKIKDKMAPGSWEKYDNTGRWVKPADQMQSYGLISNNAAEANLVPTDVSPAGYDSQVYDPNLAGTVSQQGLVGSALKVINISWNSYLGLYIGTPEHRSGANNDQAAPLTFYATDDLSTQKWRKLGSLAGYQNASWYRFMVDAGSASQQAVTGKLFRSYCYISCTRGGAEYVDVTLQTATPWQPVAANRTWIIRNQQNVTLGGDDAQPGGASGWRAQPTGDGFYRLLSAGNSQLALGVVNDRSTIQTLRQWGAPVGLVNVDASAAAPTNLNSLAQQWQIQPVFTVDAGTGKNKATGQVRLINRLSGLALSFSSAGGNKEVVTAPARDWQCTGDDCVDKRTPQAQVLTFSAR